MTLLARQTGSRASPKSTARSYLCTMSDSGHQEPGEAAIPRAGRRRLTRRDARVVLRNEQGNIVSMWRVLKWLSTLEIAASLRPSQ